MDNIPRFLITVSIVGRYLYQIRKVLSLQMFPFQQNKRRAIRSSFGLIPREHVKSDYWNEVYHLGFKLSIVASLSSSPIFTFDLSHDIPFAIGDGSL